MGCIRLFIAACLTAAVLALPVMAREAPEADWKKLFDGKTLNGWHHFGEGEWVVENGAIVGRTQKTAKLYSLLVSDGVYMDFTVRFKFKAVTGNSGFYIRTVTESPDKAHGLQIEVDPQNNSGGIYESYRRKWIDKPTAAEQAAYFKPGEWNDVTVAAYGGDVKVTVNGVTTAELTSDPSRPAGQFALQMHAGNEMLVMFKDIEILAVSRSGEDKKGPTSPKKLAAGEDGTLVLPVRHATLTGSSLAYMPEWDALGFWRDQDHAAWEVEVPQAGIYDVTMEWSVSDESAGNLFAVEAGTRRLETKVASTGRWDVYRIEKIGRLQLEAGAQTITLKPNGSFQTSLMDLRELRLTPVP